eukprot:1815923-Prymnesium_polylepis.1
MVEPAMFADAEKIGRWFDLAMAYNRTLEAKEPKSKPKRAAQPAAPPPQADTSPAGPRAKRRRPPSSSQAASSAAAEVLEVTDDEAD